MTTIHAYRSVSPKVGAGGWPEKEGWLQKKGHLNPSWKRRWWVLSEGVVRYYKSPGTDLKPQGTFSVKAVLVVIRGKYGFDITSSEYGRVYSAKAEDREDMLAWIRAIEKSAELHSERSEMENEKRLVKFKPSSSRLSLGDWELGPLTIPHNFYESAGANTSLSAWRSTLTFRGSQGGVGGVLSSEVCTASTTLAQELSDNSYFSSFALHQNEDIGALGGMGLNDSGDPLSVRLVQAGVKGKPMSAPYQLPAVYGRVLVCTHLSWKNNILLCSANKGRVYLFNASPTTLRLRESPSEKESKRSQCGHSALFNHPKAPTDTSSNIRQCELDLTGETFCSLHNRNFYIWDITRSDQPLMTQQGSKSALTTMSWNPHNADVLALGTHDCTLKIVDTRTLQQNTNGRLGFHQPHAHTTSISTIAWHPLCSHWIATGGEDGSIKVWDRRQSKTHLRSVKAHSGAVTQVAWSRAHCEILYSGGIDGMSRVWNFRIKPNHEVACVDNGDSVIGVHVSSSDPFRFYTATAEGDVISNRLTKGLLEKMVNHKADETTNNNNNNNNNNNTLIRQLSRASSTDSCRPSGYIYNLSNNENNNENNNNNTNNNNNDQHDKHDDDVIGRNMEDEADERLIEQLLYEREEDAAFKVIVRTAKRYWNQERYGDVASLLKMTSNGFFSTAVEKTKDCDKALHDATRCIVNHENALKISSPSQEVEASIKELKLRVALAKLTDTGKYKEILKLQDQLCKQLHKQSDRFSSASLKRLVGAVVKGDAVRGVSFAIAVGDALASANNFPTFIEIALLLLSPSLYGKLDTLVDISVTHSIDDEKDPVDGRERAISEQPVRPKGTRAKGLHSFSSSNFNSGLSPEIEYLRALAQTMLYGNSTTTPLLLDHQTIFTPIIGEKICQWILKENKFATFSLAVNMASQMLEACLLCKVASINNVASPRLSPSKSMLRPTTPTASPLRSKSEQPQQQQHKLATFASLPARRPNFDLNAQYCFSPDQFYAFTTETVKKEKEKESKEKEKGFSHKRSISQNPKSVPRDERAALETGLRNSKFVLPQLELLHRLLEVVASDEKLPSNPWSEDAKENQAFCMDVGVESAERVIQIMKGKTQMKNLLPVMIHRIYLSSLLVMDDFDTLYIWASSHAHAFKTQHIHKVLMFFMEKDAFPSFKRWLADQMVTDNQQPWRTEGFIKAILACVKIFCHCQYIPYCLQKSLPNTLSQLEKSLSNALKEIMTNNKYQAVVSPIQDARDTASRVLQSIGHIKESVDSLHTPYEFQRIEQLVAMLKKHTKNS